MYARTTAPRDATLRALYGALAPVAVLPPAGDVQICPGRDTRVRAGDEVTLFKSLGIAVEDLAAGRHIYAKALAAGKGTALAL